MNNIKIYLFKYFFLLLATSFNFNIIFSEDATQKDPYEIYIKTSQDFKKVKQTKDICWNQWKEWTYMPWRYHWSIGYGEDADKFCKDNGYNGAFIDRGDISQLNWINKNKLNFYVDHTAGKGDLYITDSNKLKSDVSSIVKNRTPLINENLFQKLKGIMNQTIGKVKDSPFRSAYALDDELSWGSFVKPCMWIITEDDKYRAWLDEIYGKGNAPENKGWISYEDIRKEITNSSLENIDCSQLMDQLTFNDSYWINFIGSLVEYANSIDAATPVGFVGGQSPNAFGGFDYAKIMRKVQFLEAYNLGSSQSIIRSFNQNNIPTITTHFFNKKAADPVADTSWQVWYYLAHGNRGHIGWVEGWFDGKTKLPKDWHSEVGKHYKEANKISKLMINPKWIHDEVAIYYSQSSIQMSWMLDATAFGNTWPKRNGDHKLGTSHNSHHAWENMLRDEGIQYNFINYVDVIQDGIPKEYTVLILPAVYCLSNIESIKIKEFCENGGTVISDFLPGVFDQHGKGRKNGGVLDDLFGVKHDPKMKEHEVFSDGLWVEVNQDAKFYDAGNYLNFLKNNSSIKDESGFNKAVKSMKTNIVKKNGNGIAVLMNLSPFWYSAYRQTNDPKIKDYRNVFMKHVKSQFVKPWVRLEANESLLGYEICYWLQGDKIILYVVSNPEVVGNEEGGGNSTGLKTDSIDVTLQFDKPLKNVKNEREDKMLGNAQSFSFKWKQAEAIVISFDK